MAFNLTDGGGRRSRGLPAMSEINVTPFVDVVLVLLIIFIITAHVMDYGIEVNVPKTRTVASVSKDSPVVVLISSKGELFLGNSPINKVVELADAIHKRYPGQTDVYVRADGQATWELVANVSAALANAKLNLKFVTEPADSTSRRPK